MKLKTVMTGLPYISGAVIIEFGVISGENQSIQKEKFVPVSLCHPHELLRLSYGLCGT
jgi:hypothetical protein